MIKRGQVNLETPDQRVGACVHVLGFQVLFDGGRLLGVGTPSRKQTAWYIEQQLTQARQIQKKGPRQKTPDKGFHCFSFLFNSDLT